VITIGNAISANADIMSKDDRNKYRQFLLSELKKLDAQEKAPEERGSKIDVE
jgi:hypothetical protein